MPPDPQSTESDEASGESSSDSEQWRLAREMAAEMSRAYGSSLERDAGTDFRLDGLP